MKACSLSEKQRLNDVALLATFLNCIVLLKGNNTLSVAPNSPIYINSSGTPALATAGTGDILAGFVAGIIAQNIDPLEATCTGAFIHGAAAEISNLGIRAFSADSLLKLIPVVMQNISPFA
jgi:NAD(P)H-hydrate repair Nnr-like enzyme with NAD(P)H-hydrate dehydratase domain